MLFYIFDSADKYVAYTAPDAGTIDGDIDKPSVQIENGFLMDTESAGQDELPCKDALPNSTYLEKSGALVESKRLSVAVSEIRELVGDFFNIVFEDNPPVSMTLSKGEYYSQV